MSTLAEDVNRLGRVLGTVLREQRGARFFELVEEVRLGTKERRQRGADPAPLQARLASVDLADAEGLVRAFSMYFQLVNLAEEHERVRRAEEGAGRRHESLEDALRTLAERGVTKDEARAILGRVELGLTFTAHPTEMRRRTVREHLAAIAAELSTLHDAGSLERITAHVEALWGTLELRRAHPTVHDEVRGGLAYLPVIASVLPSLERELRAAFRTVYGEDAELSLPLAFSSWMGGDRDGNPNVTPEVTRETFAHHTWQARALLRAEIASAYASLSQHAGRVPAPRAIDGCEEPWREALRAVHDRLGEGGPFDPVPPLEAVERTLREAGQHRSAEVFALPLCVRARAFGVHLASLDIREHAMVTGAAVAELLARGGVSDRYESASEEERRAILRAELRTARPLLPVGADPGEELERVLGPLRAARDAVANAGPRAFGRYVVSMSEDVSDLLEVLILAREVGVRALPVPLFETRHDLARAPEVLRDVLAMPEYRAHLGGDVQEVMIGYSDSNKDAGFFAAHWSLYEAQRRMAEVAAGAGVRWRFFHGRGTSIGRGGGPMVRGILGQPPGTIGAGLRITEQGEALADKYSRPESARRNLEQAIHGLLIAASTRPEPLPARWSEAMDRAAEASVRAYRALVEDPAFLAFFRAVTPIEEIARLRIASRPVRRPGTTSLHDLRAIPWVMSWTQNRANVPGWYGLAVALDELGIPLSRELYAGAPFFRSMLDNAQLALAMSDESIFRAYLSLAPEGDRLGPRILAARKETIDRVVEVTGGPLLASEPAIARSIELRNPYVEPIHRLQVELLRRARASAELDPELERALLLSIHGVAAGVRNAG
ncbi:MAG TPA: phosphoenolpyruvate carboxylase [Sandaracinaceae bacterium]